MSLESGDRTEVNLPRRIVERVEQRVPYTEFDSSEAYITYVLEEVLFRVEESSDGDPGEAVEEEDVKDRLKSLGYLDE
jgi:hypothetical protein